jgi:hypothetical protein
MQTETCGAVLCDMFFSFVYDKHLYFLRYSRKENISAHSQLSVKLISLQIREIYKNAMGLTCKSEINSEFTKNDCYLLRSQSLQLSRIFGDNVHRSSCWNRLTATAHEQIMRRQRKHNAANIFLQNEATQNKINRSGYALPLPTHNTPKTQNIPISIIINFVCVCVCVCVCACVQNYKVGCRACYLQGLCLHPDCTQADTMKCLTAISVFTNDRQKKNVRRNYPSN